MKKFPPHLPPKSCSVAAHSMWLSVKWLATILLISALAGVAASLAVVAWVVPVGGGSYVVNRFGPSVDTPQSLDANVVRQVRQRIIKLYDKRKAVGGGVYPESAQVGQAMLLSSDGWSVMHDPAFKITDSKQWRGVDHQGDIHLIEKLTFDAKSGLVFFKFKGTDFRVAPFISWETIQEGGYLWSVDGTWKAVKIGDRRVVAEGTFNMSQVYARDTMNPATDVGNIVISDKGDLAGFVGEHGELISAWFAHMLLPQILEKGSAYYAEVPIAGFFVDAVESEGKWKELTGFYVARVERVEKGGVRVGDVIMKINGKAIDQFGLHREVLGAEELVLTVLRGGKEIEVNYKNPKS